MWEFIIGCTAAWIFFRFLDHVFMPRLPRVTPGRKRIAIQDANGDWYICEERETSELSDKIEVPEHHKPDLRVVK